MQKLQQKNVTGYVYAINRLQHSNAVNWMSSEVVMLHNKPAILKVIKVINSKMHQYLVK